MKSDFRLGDIVRFKQCSASWDVWKIIGRSFGRRLYVISTFDADEPALVLDNVVPELLDFVEPAASSLPT